MVLSLGTEKLESKILLEGAGRLTETGLAVDKIHLVYDCDTFKCEKSAASAVAHSIISGAVFLRTLID